MQLEWINGEPDYYLVAKSGNDVFPVQFQIEKTQNGSFWAYANGAILGHSTDIEGVKDVCQKHHEKWHS